MMPIKLGITGGIGSGKSVVSHVLEVMGIPVYISDIEAKRLTEADPYIRRELIDLLGDEVYTGGKLNKQFLADYLFSDAAHAAKVNNIIHPQVKEDFRQWTAQYGHCDMLAIESAILIEAGFAGEVDHIAMVYAPMEIRISRAMERDHSPRETVVKRIQNQMSDEEKKKMAHSLIINDNTQPIIPQIEHLVNRLRNR